MKLDDEDERERPRRRPDAARASVADEVGPVARRERDDDRPDQRQERDDRQDREAWRTSIVPRPQRATMRKYEPAMTIRPSAMPSA